MRAFAIAVGEYIVEKSIEPYGDGDSAGTDPKKPFACSVCRAASFESRSEQKAHLAECLALHQDVGIDRTQAPTKAVKAIDFPGDLVA
jgi:hypothetical protein